MTAGKDRHIEQWRKEGGVHPRGKRIVAWFAGITSSCCDKLAVALSITMFAGSNPACSTK